MLLVVLEKARRLRAADSRSAPIHPGAVPGATNGVKLYQIHRFEIVAFTWVRWSGFGVGVPQDWVELHNALGA